ncbi:MAG TPA: phospho-N-acetylmuramoyl-pentapeptide-transferase [bacterium]|nr:MAG: Phospho-N-acetylmuramoyl-pentapeptide-transferase [bacterium ADurb.Bin236]HOY64815.1 phospho-N-acetylmuramoyl-pentapeptide-transferase [bacterium]HPI76067.1 phospho-N-acetylmuramoyl-pentapeptide-transferase [bacterium]HPN93572.1 phospho-N-acetylmuramoyl-pentapeptide-transferase [bacterium]
MSLLASAGLGFALCLGFTRLWMVVLAKWKMRQVIRTDGPESHLKKSGTLTMGGVAMFAAWSVATAVASNAADVKIRALFIIAATSFAIGFIDDFAKFRGKKTEGLKARYKILIEITLGAFLGAFVIWHADVWGPGAANATAIWTPKWFGALNVGVLFIPFVIVVYIGTINAVNLNDGLDGLMSGCVAVVLAALGFFISKYGDRTLLPPIAALVGVLVGFLWFNTHPAKIFAGDTGSLFLGGAVAAVAVMARLELFLVVAGAVLVLEALSVILQVGTFRLTGKRLLPMAPLHHSFEKIGWSEPQIVVRFWIVSCAFAAVAIWMF